MVAASSRKFKAYVLMLPRNCGSHTLGIRYDLLFGQVRNPRAFSAALVRVCQSNWMEKGRGFSDKATPRVVGALLILQMAGLIVPYAMLHPISRGEWLTNAAAAGGQIRAAVLGLLLTCAVAIWIAFLLRPVLRTGGAKLLIAVSIIMLALQTADVVHLLQMLALSEQHVRGISVETAALELAATRRTVHYAGLLSIDAWMFLMYGLVYGVRLVPRGVAGLGFLTVASHFFGLLIPMILGGKGIVALGATMVLGHLVLAGWLIARGFLPYPTSATTTHWNGLS